MDLSLAELVVAWAIILVGASVRGFTGFGASLIWVSGLTLLIDPDEAVPVIFLLEIAASAQLVKECWEHVDWPSLRWIMSGALVGLPLGAAVLLVLEPEPMQLVVSIVVLVSVFVLASGRRLADEPGPRLTTAAGLTSGILNGATSVGGPPIVVLYMGSMATMASTRATLIAYFGMTDIVGAAITAATGLLDRTALARFLVLLPAMAAGAALGARGFGGASEQRVRHAALVVLAVVAVVGIARAVF